MGKEYPISKISVIMVDAGFRERFHAIDFLNRQTLAREKYELIWVEYYDDVKEELREREGVKIFTLNRTGSPYHMAYCFNEGIKQSKGDLLVVMDADQVVSPNFLETIWHEHEKCPDLAMYLQRWNEFKEQHTGDISLQHLKKVCKYTSPGNYGGCLTIRKKWLLKVNGYEQHPIFAGQVHTIATEMYTRLKNLGLHVKWHPHERVYHPWHPRPPMRVRASAMDVLALQGKVIKARALSLTTLPYMGLDGNIYEPSDPRKVLKEGVTRKSPRSLLKRLAKRLLTG